MPQGSPIARMLFEHEITRHLTNSLRKSADLYISTGHYKELLEDIEKYTHHVTLHHSKENQRLFVMADLLLADQEEAITTALDNVEQVKLNHFQNTRRYCEELVEKITLSKNSL